jgi:hypothetical protein
MYLPTGEYVKIRFLFLVIADVAYGPCGVAVYEPGEESVVLGVQKKTPADIRTNVIQISSPVDSWRSLCFSQRARCGSISSKSRSSHQQRSLYPSSTSSKETISFLICRQVWRRLSRCASRSHNVCQVRCAGHPVPFEPDHHQPGCFCYVRCICTLSLRSLQTQSQILGCAALTSAT